MALILALHETLRRGRNDPPDGKRLVVRWRVRLMHPSGRRLARFMRGELPRAQRLAVVRHLLAGCPRCVAVTRRFWSFGERPPRDRSETLAADADDQPGRGRRRTSAVWT